MTDEHSTTDATYSGLMVEALLKSKSRRTTIDDASYIVKRLNLKPNAEVLDTPCGTGRLSIELAGYGFRVTGIDFSANSIAACKQGAAERGVAVTWAQRDMREMPAAEVFDGAFCWWDSFGYLDDEGNLAHLKAIHHALRRGGRLLIEAHVAESIFPLLPARDWNWLGDLLWMEQVTFDLPSGRLQRQWTFVRDGVTEQRTISMRIYTYRELLMLLQQVGFTEYATYSHRSDEPFRFGGSRLNVVAVK